MNNKRGKPVEKKYTVFMPIFFTGDLEQVYSKIAKIPVSKIKYTDKEYYRSTQTPIIDPNSKGISQLELRVYKDGSKEFKISAGEDHGIELIIKNGGDLDNLITLANTLKHIGIPMEVFYMASKSGEQILNNPRSLLEIALGPPSDEESRKAIKKDLGLE